MALLIPDEKCLVLHHKDFSLSSKQTLQAIIRDQWRHLPLIHPHYIIADSLGAVTTTLLAKCKRYQLDLKKTFAIVISYAI